MGQRGPAPKPTALRLLQGGRVAPDRLEREPQPTIPDECPAPPIYLQGLARREWKRVIRDLYATGVYAEIDETLLAAYCLAVQTWRAAEEELANAMDEGRGLTIETKSGNTIHSPILGVAAAARRDVLKLGAQFGLTPASRTMIDAGKSPDADPKARRYFE